MTTTVQQRHVYADAGTLVINPGENELRINVTLTPDGYEYSLSGERGQLVAQDTLDPIPAKDTPVQPEDTANHITRELSFSEGIPTQRRVDYVNRRISQLRKSVKRLRKGNEMLETLLQQADETYQQTSRKHQNYDEWNEYWVANTQRIDKLEREIDLYTQQLRKFYADPTFRKEAAINRAWKQLGHAHGTLAKHGVNLTVYTTDEDKQLPF